MLPRQSYLGGGSRRSRRGTPTGKRATPENLFVPDGERASPSPGIDGKGDGARERGRGEREKRGKIKRKKGGRKEEEKRRLKGGGRKKGEELKGGWDNGLNEGREWKEAGKAEKEGAGERGFLAKATGGRSAPLRLSPGGTKARGRLRKVLAPGSAAAPWMEFGSSRDRPPAPPFPPSLLAFRGFWSDRKSL